MTQRADRSVGAALGRVRSRFVAAVRDAYDKQSYPLGYSAGLDGLRGLMTIGVLTAHTRHALLPGSILYLDIFFVMSGYFITGLLLRDWDRHGRIRFWNFYRRRFARIVPPFAAMIAAYLAIFPLFQTDFRSTALDAGMAMAYLMNLWRAGLLPFIPNIEVSYLGHTWSLAIEEQFYILWPCALLILLRTVGSGRRAIAIVLAAALAVWAWRVWLTAGGAPWQRLYNGTDTRIDAFMVGCALAMWLRTRPFDGNPRLDRAIASAAWPLLIVGAFVSAYFVFPDHRFYYYAGSVLFGVVPGVLFVIILTRPRRTILHVIFEQPPLVFVGRIFYACYLWHLPIFAVLNWHFGLRAGTRALIGFPLVFLLAVLSYVLIERRFMRTTSQPAAAPATRIATATP